MGVSGRRLSDQCHSRTAVQRNSQFTNDRTEEEFIVAHLHQQADMKSNTNASDRRRFSTESSRASFSSSRSSSFSSVEYYRCPQPDPGFKDRLTFCKAAFQDSQHGLSPKIARKSAEFRDIVKDSMFKEARGLSIKTESREYPEAPAELQGAEWAYNERKEQRRVSDHRYRCDGMETSRLSFDSREALFASKLRDLPRLSLDGRECLTRRVDYDSASNFQLATSLKRSSSTKEKGQNLSEVSASQQRRSPSLIAKLMGLTALPDSPTPVARNDRSFIRTRNDKDGLDLFDTGKPVFDSDPPRSKKEPASPRWITSEMKPISSSKIHVEQAPWTKQENGATLIKQSPRRIRSPTRQSKPIPSVYSEIEKRFNDIEFNQSGKDLRALKQILDSIHAKGSLDNEKQEQEVLNSATSGKPESTLINAKRKSDSAGQQNGRGEQILIVKPMRSPRIQTSKNMLKDHVAKSSGKCKSTQCLGGTQQQPKDNSASSPRNLGTTSPRMRLKKLESEKHNQFSSHSFDSNRNRLLVSKQPTESSSPRRKVQQNCSQNSELLELKMLPFRTNEEPLPTYRNVALDSRQSKEATRTVQSNKVNSSHSPSKKASKQVILASNKSSNQISLAVKQDETSPEHPSPVSVLNMSPYRDDSSTEEKQLATPPEDLAEGYGAFKLNLSCELGIASDISRKKLLFIDSLVQKLKGLNSTHDESKIDYIALLCDNTNPDHRYISAILLASGLLLREFGSDAKPFQLHPSGFLINPELFNVLERTKSSAQTSISANGNESKSHRKLIFDTVNEMLTKKLAPDRNLSDYTAKHHHKVTKKAVNTQNLVKEICAEIEQLHPKKKENKLESEDESEAVKNLLQEDVMCMSSDKWNAFEGGMLEVVLDIERSLFKKLVSEIIISDYSLRPKSVSLRHNHRFLK